MQFKYIATIIASLAVSGALAIPVPDAETTNAALQDAALQARAEQIEQTPQWLDDDDDFFDWDKAKVMKRAEQAQQAQQATQANQFWWPGGINANVNWQFRNRIFLQQQNPWWFRNRLLLNRGWWY